jgi:ribosomal-protein-alanine N-acetyltransferase
VTAVVPDEVIRGEKVVLREKRSDDARDDYAWRSDPDLARYDATKPLRASFADYETLYMEELDYPSPSRRSLAIEDMSGRHIGNIMFYSIDRLKGEAELGITVGDSTLWSRGYGTDAVRAALRHVFLEMGLNRVYLKTLDWNHRARRCFEKAGFLPYGAMRRGGDTFVLMDIRRERFLRDVAITREDTPDEARPTGDE